MTNCRGIRDFDRQKTIYLLLASLVRNAVQNDEPVLSEAVGRPDPTSALVSATSSLCLGSVLMRASHAKDLLMPCRPPLHLSNQREARSGRRWKYSMPEHPL